MANCKGLAGNDSFGGTFETNLGTIPYKRGQLQRVRDVPEIYFVNMGDGCS